MTARSCTFRQWDVTRAVRAVRNAGVEVLRVEVDRTGKIVVVAGEPGKTDLPTTEGNSWDVV